MKHRIRAAAIVVKDDCVLLVKHVHPVTGEEWWVPPGGGLGPDDTSVFDCVRREVFEETGLDVNLSRIVYIREFVDRENRTHNLELFLVAKGFSGEVTTKHIHGKGLDEDYIKDVKWVSRETIKSLVVYPEILKDEFWQDLQDGFPETRYLGTQIGPI